MTPFRQAARGLSVARLLTQRLVEEFQGAVPGQCGRSFVIARRRVVVEAVIRSFVNIRRVRDVIRFKRGLVRGPSGVDAVVERGIMNQ